MDLWRFSTNHTHKERKEERGGEGRRGEERRGEERRGRWLTGHAQFLGLLCWVATLGTSDGLSLRVLYPLPSHVIVTETNLKASGRRVSDAC